ncbi:hypothetical protein D3C84_710340 [compost metagenome]
MLKQVVQRIVLQALPLACIVIGHHPYPIRLPLLVFISASITVEIGSGLTAEGFPQLTELPSKTNIILMMGPIEDKHQVMVIASAFAVLHPPDESNQMRKLSLYVA